MIRVSAIAFGILLLAMLTACETPGTTPASTPTPEAQATSPVQEPELSRLFLEIASPDDESIVGSANVEVRGRTAPDALVTVNESIADVNGDGSFAVMIALLEGPNFIEVIASDFEGAQESGLLSLIYLP